MAYDPQLFDYLKRQGLIKNPLAMTAPAAPEFSAAPAVVPPPKETPMPTPEELVPAPIKRQPTDFMDAIGMALAGYGDAMLARSGRQGKFLPATIQGIEQEQAQTMDDEARMQQRKAQVGALKMQDVQNKQARNMLFKVMPQLANNPDLQNLDRETIVKMLPLLEKTLPKQLTPEQEQDREFRQEMQKMSLNLKERELGRKETKDTNVIREDIGKKLATQINTAKPEAEGAVESIKQIKKLKGMVTPETTGLGGQLKAEFAPLFQMIGANWKAMDDAAKVQLLGRSMIGKMRLDLIGPGPVSEYEQKLLQQLAGGGKTTYPVVKELMDYYETLARKKIENYNSILKSALKVDSTFQIYEPIKLEDVAPAAGGGLTPEKQKRLELLRQKKAAGTLQGGK